MALVQSSTVASNTAGGNCTPSLPGVTAGNLLVLTVAWAQQTNGNAPTVSGWTTAVAPAGTSFLGGVAWIGTAIFYKENSGGGTESPVVVPGAGSTGSAMSAQIQEHSGFAASGLLDVTQSATATSGTSGNTGTTGTTTGTHSLVVAALGIVDATGAPTTAAGISTPASASYTSAGVRQNNSVNGMTCEFSHKMVNATGTQTGSWTWTASSAYMGVVAAFKALVPVLQEGFRFGNDDGSESAHTWAAAQDANITAPAGATRLLAFNLDATGSVGAKTFKLQYRKVGDSTWKDVPIA